MSDETVYGLTVPALPQGAIPLHILLVVEILKEDGERMLLTLSDNDLKVWEAAGFSVWLDESVRKQLRTPHAGYDGGTPPGGPTG
jgi:hypothetical protein